MSRLKGEINKSLDSYLPNEGEYPAGLHRAMRYVVMSEGHRWRPILLIAVAESFGAPREKAMPIACAVELVHNASIIVDDLPCVDNAEIRRGRKCCHIAFGEHTAMFAFGGLVGLAFQVLTQTNNSVPRVEPQAIVQITHELGYTGVEMAGGEFGDVESRNKSIDRLQLKRIVHGKSVSLYVCAARAGAILAGAGQPEIRAVTEYAKNLGFRYQVLDDIFDVAGDTKELGKRTGMDVNKPNYVSLYGLKGGEKIAHEFGQRALEALDPMGEKVARLRDLILLITPTRTAARTRISVSG